MILSGFESFCGRRVCGICCVFSTMICPSSRKKMGFAEKAKLYFKREKKKDSREWLTNKYFGDKYLHVSSLRCNPTL